jgi:FkbM family methyltransferase
VGAADPVDNNATYYFYEKGWTGINIEPDPAFFERLREVRPRDLNLNLAISSSVGQVDLIRVRGEEELNTLVEPIAQQYAEQFALDKVSVEAVSLDDVCAQHVNGGIDLLKIDVEGGEEDVLDSFDLAKWSPKLLIVEATWPCTSTPSHEGWEPKVLEAGYELGLFDGLNRFFAKADDRQTLERLQVPASLFDQFVQYRWWKLLTPAAREELAAAGYPHPPLA